MEMTRRKDADRSKRRGTYVGPKQQTPDSSSDISLDGALHSCRPTPWNTGAGNTSGGGGAKEKAGGGRDRRHRRGKYWGTLK